MKQVNTLNEVNKSAYGFLNWLYQTATEWSDNEEGV